MVLLEDEPYDPDTYLDGKTALPAVKVTVGVSPAFYEDNPEMVEFLSNYKTSSALTSEALAYMQDTGANYVETARWFLTEHSELLDEWLNEEDAEKMKGLLSGTEEGGSLNWLHTFPFKIPLNLEGIDNSVRNFSVKYSSIFDSMRSGLTNFVNLIYSILNFIPWFIFIIIIFLISWKLTSKISKGILYSLLLLLIGSLDYGVL